MIALLEHIIPTLSKEYLLINKSFLTISCISNGNTSIFIQFVITS